MYSMFTYKIIKFYKWLIIISANKNDRKNNKERKYIYNNYGLWHFHLIASINKIINFKDNKTKKYMQNKTHSYLILNFNKGLLIKIM